MNDDDNNKWIEFMLEIDLLRSFRFCLARLFFAPRFVIQMQLERFIAVDGLAGFN